jgi:hypothetical protein
VDGVIVDATEHVGEPSLRIDIIELGGLDQLPAPIVAASAPPSCTRRLKSEAVGELIVRRGVPGLGLIYKGLAETFFQHATPIMLLEPRQLFDQRLHNIC